MSKEYLIVNPDAPLIDHSLKVKLPNGSFNSVNVFEYNLTSVCYQTDPERWLTIELDDGSHIQFKNLTPIFASDGKNQTVNKQ